MEWVDIYAEVRSELVEALAVEPGSITPQASLAADLGADSLDLMDLIVRLNRRFSLKMSAKQLQAQLLEQIQPGETNGAGQATNINGAAAAPAAISLIEKRRKMAEILTVRALTDLVAQELGAAKKAPISQPAL